MMNNNNLRYHHSSLSSSFLRREASGSKKWFMRSPFDFQRRRTLLQFGHQDSSDDSSTTSASESTDHSSDFHIRMVIGRQTIRSLHNDTIPAMIQWLNILSSSPFTVQTIPTIMNNNDLFRTKTTTTDAEYVNHRNNENNQYKDRNTTNTAAMAPNLQVALVRLGTTWSQQQQQIVPNDDNDMMIPESMIHITSSRNRVPGCISTVHVQTTLCHKVDDSKYKNTLRESITATTTIQSISGTTDSYMSRGLLACIAQVLTNVTVEEIMSLNIPHLIRQLSLDTVLSSGRNDGLTSMIRVIQSQVQECVGRLPQQSQSKLTLPVDASSPVIVSSLQPPKLELLTDIASISTSPMDVKRKTRVALLLSGGVDSSVALHLLMRGHNKVQYDVTAFYLKIWLEDELSDLNICPWEEDVQYCKAVCQQLNVPLETISLQEEYNDHILSYTIDEAKSGRTPNPDILCNRRIKFGCFYNVIMDRNFDYIATGHYAQVIHDTTQDGTNGSHLHRAPDPVKDQSYFLCALSQEQLQRVLFPIGHLSKAAVRQYAEQCELPNRYRPDSQGLCFLGKVKFDTFLNTYIADRPGPIIDATNDALVGYHRGLWYHTIGQRKGLGKVLFPNATSIGPWYVVGKNTDTNTIFCTNQYDEDAFIQTRSEFAVEAIHWIAGTPPLSTLLISHSNETVVKSLRLGLDATDCSVLIFDLRMKIRHGPNLVQGYLTVRSDNIINGLKDDNGSTAQHRYGFIHLQNCKDSGLAPGQYVSFYDAHSTECYGCAVISENNWVGVSQSPCHKFVLIKK